jgi:hypothetical protein
MEKPRMALLVAFTLLALGAPARPLSAQLLTGQRVHVEISDAEWLTGTITALSAEAVSLDIGGTSRTFPRSSLTKVEVSTGIRSYWKTGAAVGAVVGAVGTFVVLDRGGSTNPCDSDANQDAMGMGACVGIAALGGLGGALIGGFVGSLAHSERWETVPLDEVRLGLLAPSGGRSLGLTVALTLPRR